MARNTNINSIVQKDGASIYMPKWFRGQSGWGNLAHPNVYAATSEQGWPCGTIYREGERTFVFTGAGSAWDSGATTKNCGYLLRTKATYKKVSSGMQSAAIDATEIVVNYETDCALDKYSGGTLGVYGTSYGTRFIVSQSLASTATATDYDMDLVLDVGFPVAMATTDNITLLENRWKDINDYVTDEYSPYLGAIMHHGLAVSEYSWLQCGGVNGLMFYWGTPTGAANSGMQMYGYHGAVQAIETYSTDTIGDNVSGAVQIVGEQAGYTTSDMDGGMQVYLTILR